MSLARSNFRIGTSLLLVTAPLVLLFSGCGGGNSSPTIPTSTPSATATGTPNATTTVTPTTTATPKATTTGTPRATATPTSTTALDFSSLGSGADYDGSIYEQGWRFTPNSTISVTSLGFYDQSKNGLGTTHKVGIFDVGTLSLLASTTVSPSDPLTGYFRFHDLTAPVTLTPGRDYYIVAVLNYAGDGFTTGVNPLTVNSSITFQGSASDIGGNANGDLVYPDSYLSGNKGNFGPNFLFK